MLKRLVIALAAMLTLSCDEHAPENQADPLPPGDATVVAVASNFSDTFAAKRVVLPQVYQNSARLFELARFLVPRLHQQDGLLVIYGEKVWNDLRIDDADRLIVLRTSDFSVAAEVRIPPGTKPTDVVIAHRRLFVSDYLGTGLLMARLDHDEPTALPITLGVDPDWTPNCTALTSVGAQLWVLCIAKDDFMVRPRNRAAVVAVDAHDPGKVLKVQEFEQERARPGFVSTPHGIFVATGRINSALSCAERLVARDDGPEATGCFVHFRDLMDRSASGEVVVPRHLLWDGARKRIVMPMGFDGMVYLDPVTGTFTQASAPHVSGRPTAVCPNGYIASAMKEGLDVFDGEETIADH
ncbi:MAG: hypothetical protein AAGA56_22775, partial [Myxococcota bacterium]